MLLHFSVAPGKEEGWCSCIALGRQWKVESPQNLRRTWQLLLCSLSCFLTAIFFGTWQGHFSSEEKVLTLTEKGCKNCGFIIRYSFQTEVFKSFRKWCLNYYSFRAPVVYVLTMYVCFMKLFNLQFT